MANTSTQRTTRQSTRRAAADLIVQRAHWLDTHDRLLIEQVLGKGVRPREIAPLMNRTTRSVQRHIQRLTARLTDRTVLAVMRSSSRWPRATAEVARRYFVRRHTLRQIARDLGLTYHDVRTHLQRARGAIELGRIYSPRPRQRGKPT